MNPNFAIGLAIFFGYFLVGTVWSGIVARTIKSSVILPFTLIAWPVSFPLGILFLVYALITGQTVKKLFDDL